MFVTVVAEAAKRILLILGDRRGASEPEHASTSKQAIVRNILPFALARPIDDVVDDVARVGDVRTGQQRNGVLGGRASRSEKAVLREVRRPVDCPVALRVAHATADDVRTVTRLLGDALEPVLIGDTVVFGQCDDVPCGLCHPNAAQLRNGRTARRLDELDVRVRLRE